MTVKQQHSSFQQCKHTQGFTILEILIAGFLGLVLMAGVTRLFVGSKQTFRLQEELSNVQEQGHFALKFLQSQMENAGFVSSTASVGGNVPAIDFISGDTTDGGAGGNDSIKVQMEVPAGTLDCNGNAIPTSTLSAHFFVNGNDSLMCQGSGGGQAQPVIENVESFQVLYGIDTSGNGVVNRYVKASDVAATTGYPVTFDDVIAVQLAILVATENEVSDTTIVRAHEVLDETFNQNDELIRRQFRQTILLHNKVYQMIGHGAKNGTL